MSAIVDLAQLPAPAVVESLDYESLLAERKAALLALVPEADRAAVEAALALESEPLSKLLQENVYRELVLRQRINEATQAVMLAYATGTDLDQIAANCNVTRFLITPANTNVVPPTSAVWEADADLRIRVQQAFEGLSVAGPRGAYVFHARGADARVADASAISPAPAEVVVTVLARDGDGAAPQELVDIVAAALNDEWIRPVADRLTVQSVQVAPYTIDAALYIYPGPESEPIRQAAIARLIAYVQAQRRLGRDIRRSAVIAALHAPGVQRVELTQPSEDIVLDETQAGYCTGYTVTVGGYDD
jgi:phage-related baseplate assembly protein